MAYYKKQEGRKREGNMGKKIVILNGSPRRAGNTAALTAEFTKGAKEAGNTVTEFFLDGMDIHGCKGCFGGKSSRECPCVQRDDMDKIYPAVKECDVVVLATPLYYWNMSGQIRTAIDRLFALEEGDGNLLRGHGRASALLMAAEGNGFDDVLLYYDHLMEHLKWENLGAVLAGGNGHVGEIEGKPELQKAYELGKSIR
jgi:multimeric flavodoxin WrbA